jgi:hypothetical protein
MALTADQKKQVAAGALFVVLAGVVYYQFFTSTATPTRPTTQATPRPSPSPSPLRLVGGGPPLRDEVITGPLPIAMLAKGGVPEGGTGRNIFVYPTPTPPPPPTPTPTPIPIPPPPITLAGVNPSGVIARTHGFAMTVVGGKIPPDAVVFINGRAYPTTFLNETQVKADVPADAIVTPGNLRVEVKSKADPQGLYSNPVNLNVAAPPVPPFQFVAFIVDTKGVEIAVLKSQADGKLTNLRQGESINNWKLISISPQKIEMVDTNYNIQHSVNFTAEATG